MARRTTPAGSFRPACPASAGAHREWIAWHGLSSGEVAEIQRAIARGAVLENVRLRAAAVEAARTQLAVWGGRGDVAQRVRLVLALIWVGVIVILVVASVLTGDWSWNHPVIGLDFLAVVIPEVLLRRNLRRAMDLNRESAL